MHERINQKEAVDQKKLFWNSVPIGMEGAQNPKLFLLDSALTIIFMKGSSKKMVFYRNISQANGPSPPLGTFKNKNMIFGQKSQVFEAKNNVHQNFT